jgi:hypothetical protein
LKPERVAELLYKFSPFLIKKTYNNDSNFKIDLKVYEYNYGTHSTKDTVKNPTDGSNAKTLKGDEDEKQNLAVSQDQTTDK